MYNQLRRTTKVATPGNNPFHFDSLHKAPKTMDSTFQQPADHNEKPRESPVMHKTRLNISSSSASTLDTTTIEALSIDNATTPQRHILPICYGSEHEASPSPRPHDPLPLVSPSLSADPSFDLDKENMNIDSDNQNIGDATPQLGMVQPAPTLGHAGTTLLVAIAPALLPTHGELMALVPTGCTENPQ
ncbi:hypothetical protein B0H10DRAFT_1949583 [Mycena sp. CBHHK59/15]|nr:hypothetical protein B0H10DRAFT_1949583 [Mycena sp. CBHHK59/15]